MSENPQQILEEAMQAARFDEEKKKLYRRRMSRALLLELAEAEKLFAGARAPGSGSDEDPAL